MRCRLTRWRRCGALRRRSSVALSLAARGCRALLPAAAAFLVARMRLRVSEGACARPGPRCHG
jgi:hypothetical protein